MVGKFWLANGKFDLRIIAFNHDGKFAIRPCIRIVAAENDIVGPYAQ
ncbi:hypothetical protein B194_2785 [Serratia plymuthica A30]|nr:hypothetical protein B194_2785 [Serratia plymuthica A30]